jgi:hypothetical protein
MWLWGKFRNLRYLLFMDKRLLEEISRQKELMMVNEQLAQTVFGGLKDAMGQAIFKSFMDSALGGNEDESSDTSKETDDSTTSTNTETPIGKISAKGQELLNNPIFKKKLKEISQAISIPESSIIKLMKPESGLNPMSKNSIGCVGLIQFCPGGGSTKVVNGKSYSLEELRNNLEVQMDAIKDFWVTGYKMGKIRKPADLYIYNFFPVAAGKPDDFVLQSKGLSAKTVAKANPVFNRTLGKEISSPLTVGDLKQYYQKTGMV